MDWVFLYALLLLWVASICNILIMSNFPSTVDHFSNASAGLNYLQFCNLHSFRTLFILGFSSYMAISAPHYFGNNKLTLNISPFYVKSEWFNDAITIIFISSPVVAVMVGMLLDPVYCEEDARNDSGKLWWERFFKFDKEIRKAEFNSLP